MPDRSTNRSIARTQVIGRHVAFETELVEQRFLRHRPFAHHRFVPTSQDD